MSGHETIKNIIQTIPKAELHIHIEGSLEPEMMFKLAQRNGIQLKYSTINEIRQAYNFANLQEFLDLYYQGMSVLLTEQDFFDLTYAYLTKANNDNVTYVELFFDFQAHLARGVALSVVFNGIEKAIHLAQQNYGIEAKIIVCFLRHLSQDEALAAFDKLLDFRSKFIGIGLDSSEFGFPPRNFKLLFERARQEKLHLVAHAGEEGPSEYVWEALDLLGVERIDHGNAVIQDESLLTRIAKDKIALTMCPLSNKALHVIPDLSSHPAFKLLQKGVKVTLNSDDPAYFGGYINQNYIELATALNLSSNEIHILAENSLSAKFI